MSNGSVREQLNGCQAQPADLATFGEDRLLVLHLWKVAIEQEQWTFDAIAAHWKATTATWEEPIGVDGNYVSKQFRGEKAFTARHHEVMPADVRVRFAKLLAEAYGLTVIEPLRGAAAAMSFAAGLIGLFMAEAPALPERSSGQLKSGLPMAERRRA